MKTYIYILILILTSSLFAQKNKEIQSMISLTARAVTPIGIFSENWNTGGAIYLSYGLVYQDTWGVQIQAGYNKYRLKSASQYSDSPKLSMFTLQIGGRYYFLDGIIKPFVVTMTGVNIITLFYNSNDTIVDESKTHLNYQVGTGIAIDIINNFELEFLILYNSHLINPSVPYNLTGIEYGVGINWVL